MDRVAGRMLNAVLQILRKQGPVHCFTSSSLAHFTCGLVVMASCPWCSTATNCVNASRAVNAIFPNLLRQKVAWRSMQCVHQLRARWGHSIHNH